MNPEKLDKNQKKDLTKSDKADLIWAKLKIEAQQIGYGTLSCKVIVHNGSITEVQHWPARRSIRAE